MNEQPLDVQRLDRPQEATECAKLMAASEPWITLRRTVDQSLAAVTNSRKEVYVVRDAVGVAAFVILDMNGPFPSYLQTICVRPDCRGRGLGASLIQWAEERIFRDSPNVFMCVSSFNHAAQRLYSRLGYEIVGVLRGYVVPEHDEILLRKTRGALTDFHKTALEQPIAVASPQAVSTPHLVRTFYCRIWNDGDLDAVADVLSDDFHFRGSLGAEMQGRESFKEYVRSVRGCLSDYRCEILACVAEGEQAFAQMRFSGMHVAPFRGYEPTGKKVEWLGAALFRFDVGKIAALWVLGDLAGLDAVLSNNRVR